jgi:hypothetical protein
MGLAARAAALHEREFVRSSLTPNILLPYRRFRVNHQPSMTEAEMEIIEFLKLNRESFYARKEISRKARRRQEYEEDPQWASAPLNTLVAQGIVDQNDSGHYKLSDKYDA